MQELDALCAKGESQTELVMLVMLRLAEDVVLLQTLEQQQRRKEIHAALVAHMEQGRDSMAKKVAKEEVQTLGFT